MMMADDGVNSGPTPTEEDVAVESSSAAQLNTHNDDEEDGPPLEAPPGPRKWATNEDFAKHRELITELYGRETLAELMQRMQADHGFIATNKMYRARFKRWGLGKRKFKSGVIPTRAKRPPPVPEPEPQPRSVVQAQQQLPQPAHHQQPEPEEQCRESPPVSYPQKAGRIIFFKGKWVDLSKITDPNRRRTIILQHQRSRQLSAASVSSSSSSALSRTPSPPLRGPDTFQSMENMYRAIRDYYSGSFAANRWVFVENVPEEEHTTNPLVVQTQTGVRRGFEIWRRFNTALRLFHDPSHSDNRAQAIKIIRICFAELTATLLSGRESPLLLFWVMHIMTLFRNTPGAGFGNMEPYLLKHLFELTETIRLRDGRQHPTATLWRILWSGGKGALFESLATNDPEGHMNASYAHLSTCITAAADQFAGHFGETHKRTVELRSLAIYCSLPMFHPRAHTRLEKFQDLFAKVTNQIGEFDARDMDVRGWLASQYFIMGRLDDAAALLEPLVDDPAMAAKVASVPEATEAFYLLFGGIRMAQGRMAEAEVILQQVVDAGNRAWRLHGEELHLSDGLLALEQCLRAQGRMEEADEAVREHRQLLREALVKRGETDSV
ncbi:hypothetical protein QBC35DRAFT_497037 [Podospora australis]|uniref:Clr5 domain-containing protein n=1 Tax=Podospora australis TaxID=1536484 RepID=A0AAN6WU86_9PEZI|nr:hypothetical protein QBC35DRAFT_497037 [Podospora australis]